MDKFKLLKIFDTACFVAGAFGVVCVLLFEFFGINFAMTLAIMSYVITFLAFAIFLGLKLFFAFKKEEQKDEIFLMSTKKKVLNIILLVLSVALLIFSLVVLSKV